MYIRRKNRLRVCERYGQKIYGHARDVSLLALLFERHRELAVRVRAGRGLGADAPVEHGNLSGEDSNMGVIFDTANKRKLR